MKVFGALRAFFFFFTPYAHRFERKAENFFLWVNSTRDSAEVHRRLLGLMQENLLVLNVWLEKRFKNYRFLTRGYRKKMYKNAASILHDFESFRTGRRFHQSSPQLEYLAALCAYFDPKGRFQYLEGCTFAKLLVDPAKARMTGDCNQIVTLFAWLFAQKFPIQDLQIKLIPGHVCLHYQGIDIEATNGTFQHYQKFDFIAPITELIATNILDITDSREASASIAPETFVKSSQLAYAISSKREIVSNNLQAAYQKLCLAALNQKNFDRALYYAEKSGNRDLLRACWSRQFNDLAQKVRGIKKISDAKRHRDTYRRMLELARQLGDQKAEQSLQKLIEQIRS